MKTNPNFNFFTITVTMIATTLKIEKKLHNIRAAEFPNGCEDRRIKRGREGESID